MRFRGRGPSDGMGLESLSNHHLSVELLDSRRDEFNQDIKDRGTNNQEYEYGGQGS